MSPTDDRNARPRTGSPLWWYIWTVVAMATALTAVALAGLRGHNLAVLAQSPAFWLVAAPMAVTALRPIVPKGRSGDGTFALVVFLFALLMHIGLRPVLLLCVVTMFVRGVLYKQAVHRNLFNVGQHALTLGGVWLVLRAFSINASPEHPWAFNEPRIAVSQLLAVILGGLVYLVINNGSVFIAVALIESRPLLRIIRDDLRHLAVVGVAMVSLAPLVLVVMVHVWPFVPLFYPALVSLYHNATLSVAREHDALHDSLTSLGNRQLLHREGSKALADLGRQDDGVAILVLDLDKFKEVNDTLGHAAGDRLLQVVAERLRTAVRPEDVVARLGGDEFVVIVRGVPDTTSARLAAVRLIERVNGTCQIDGSAITIAASLGVAVAPAHGVEFDALLRRADRAMYIAKSTGCGVAVFDPRRDEDWRRPAMTLEQPLGAVESGRY
ncbi:MAG TPA: GGDEF domain-containing protein [Acidothermaceae bacterium]|nr:GGDEF domain-containing protein [Acidothermaceae bacterium]